MAVYQPIQMPGGSGDFGDAFDRIFRAREASRQADQQRAELLLKQQAQQQQGQLQQAQIQNYQSEAAQRATEETARQQQRDLTARQAIMKALDAGQHDLAKQIAVASGVTIAHQAPSVTQMPGNTTMAPLGVDLTAPPAEGETTDAVFKRNADAIASNAPQAPKPPTGWTINGTPYDPAATEAAADAERAKEAKRVGSAYEALNFGPQASALVLGNTGKPPEVDQAFIATKKAEEAAAQRQMLLDQRLEATRAQHERENMTVAERLSENAKNRAAKIEAAKQGGDGARTDQSNLAGYKYVDQVTKEGAKELGLPKLNESLSTIDLALKELQKLSGAAQIGGRMALERALRGGPPTQYMDQMEQNHLGGAWARLEGAIQTAIDGGMAPGQIEAIVHEGNAAKEAMSAARDRRLAAIKGRLERDPALQNMRGSVNERYRQIAEGMGAPAEDIFPGEVNALPPVGAGAVANKPKPTVRERLTSGTKSSQANEERKKRLIEETRRLVGE